MTRVASHDHAAFRELLSRHLDSIHRYLLRLAGSAEDADDFAQETFLRVWLNASKYEPGRVAVTTWVHRIAHNVCVDEMRRRRGTTTLAQVLKPHTDEPDESGPKERFEHLQAALGSLPEAQRSAIVLCRIQGFSNRDAARIMNVSVRALESLLARARRKLRLRLAELER
ncbi:MAG: sigma-70 family RNA polymerase sigma factor [Pseudomonadales bacterium]|nr:sigma-70 family RNA polymerase sigma factor [Pseudomonadales bacterium]NIX09647.1 sigma-70 family RNA polymerase sigma factor [Pseudomonadales bacterium]